MNEPDNGDLFIRRLTELQALQATQLNNILSMVALAVQIKSLTETDMSQAIIDSKMAALLNAGQRSIRPYQTTSPTPQETK